IRAEAEEETGYRLRHVRKVFEAFMSPGAVTEKLHFFVAEYDPSMRIGDGGGIAEEGEDIEVLELPIDQALAMIADGRIADVTGTRSCSTARSGLAGAVTMATVSTSSPFGPIQVSAKPARPNGWRSRRWMK